MKTRGRPRHPDVLTPREWEVLTLVREGLTNPQIAEQMGITLDAAKYHVSEILSKLHLGSRAEAAAWQPAPPQEPVLRPSWANALGGWWPLIARVAGAGVVAAAVAGLGVLAYGVMNSEGEDDPRVGAAPPAAAPPSEAERIIAEGHLGAYAVAESGAVLTVWHTCGGGGSLEPDCGNAWRLGTGPDTLATGMVGRGGIYHGVGAYASGDGFLITPPTSYRLDPGTDTGLLITRNGTASLRSMDCGDATWSTPTEPQRLVWAGRTFIDTVAGTVCPARLLGARLLSGEAAFSEDGTLWALVDNDRNPVNLTIGKYDGSQWHYRKLAAGGGSLSSVLAAAGSNVVVLVGGTWQEQAERQMVGLAVTTDAGATWTEVTDPELLKRNVPFASYVHPISGEDFSGFTSMAFAGTSVLYVADGRGDVWRSTDFTTFSQADVPGDVVSLRSVGDAVIGRICNPAGGCERDELARISADGSVEFITLR